MGKDKEFFFYFLGSVKLEFSLPVRKEWAERKRLKWPWSGGMSTEPTVRDSGRKGG